MSISLKALGSNSNGLYDLGWVGGLTKGISGLKSLGLLLSGRRFV